MARLIQPASRCGWPAWACAVSLPTTCGSNAGVQEERELGNAVRNAEPDHETAAELHGSLGVPVAQSSVQRFCRIDYYRYRYRWVEKGRRLPRQRRALQPRRTEVVACAWQNDGAEDGHGGRKGAVSRTLSR